MSYVSTRKRRDRAIRAEIQTVAHAASVTAWSEFCQTINALPWTARLSKAWQVAWGVLE